MTAGRRDVLCTLQRATTAQDEYGEETLTWATLCTEWAAIFWGRGDERRQAAAEQGQQSATFQVLANLDTLSVTIKDRLSCEHGTFDIVGIAPMGRGVIELTATRSL